MYAHVCFMYWNNLHKQKVAWIEGIVVVACIEGMVVCTVQVQYVLCPWHHFHFSHTVLLLCYAREKPLGFFILKLIYAICDLFFRINRNDLIWALSVSETFIYVLHFLALSWLACFYKTPLTPPLVLRLATSPIPVSLWLGNCVATLKYFRIPVLISMKQFQ